MRFGIDVKLGVAVVLAVPLELTTRPGADDDLEGFGES